MPIWLLQKAPCLVWFLIITVFRQETDWCVNKRLVHQVPSHGLGGSALPGAQTQSGASGLFQQLPTSIPLMAWRRSESMPSGNLWITLNLRMQTVHLKVGIPLRRFSRFQRSVLDFLLKVSVFMLFLFVSSTKANCNASALKLLLNAWLFSFFNGMHFLLFWFLKIKTIFTCVKLKNSKILFWKL